MYPDLIKIGPLTIHSFGVFVALGFIICYLFLKRSCNKLAAPGRLPQQLMAAILLGGFFGAKIFFLVEHNLSWTAIYQRWLLNGAGFTWYGGFIGGAIGVSLVLLFYPGWRLKILDVIVPLVLLGYGIGRIGCQLAGDGDYGPPSDLPWAMAYPYGIAPTLVPVHPTPVYDTLLSFIFFGVIWGLRSKEIKPGGIAAISLIAIGLERFITEFFRTTQVVAFGWLTVPQLISLIFVFIGFGVWKYLPDPEK